VPTHRLVKLFAMVAAVLPAAARAWVVVRAPVYVAPVPVMVAPVPVAVAPVPVYVPPPPPPAAVLPINATLWSLPPGCLKVFVSGVPFYQCGPNWLRPVQSDAGTYYAVVPPP